MRRSLKRSWTVGRQTFRIIVSDESLLIREYCFFGFYIWHWQVSQGYSTLLWVSEASCGSQKGEVSSVGGMAESNFDLPPVFVSWQLLCKSQTGFFVQVSRSQVRDMPNLERKAILLLRFSQNIKGFISSVLTRRGTAFLVWNDSTRFLVPHVSCVPIIHPGVTWWWGGSKRGVWDPLDNLYPLRSSKVTGNLVYLSWMPSIFQ